MSYPFPVSLLDIDRQPDKAPIVRAEAPGDGLSWVAEHRDALRAAVAEHGSVMVRGLDLHNARLGGGHRGFGGLGGGLHLLQLGPRLFEQSFLLQQLCLQLRSDKLGQGLILLDYIAEIDQDLSDIRSQFRMDWR